MCHHHRIGAVISMVSTAQEFAYEESQKYKEGKYILEKAVVMKVRQHWRLASKASNTHTKLPQEGCW